MTLPTDSSPTSSSPSTPIAPLRRFIPWPHLTFFYVVVVYGLSITWFMSGKMSNPQLALLIRSTFTPLYVLLAVGVTWQVVQRARQRRAKES